MSTSLGTKAAERTQNDMMDHLDHHCAENREIIQERLRRVNAIRNYVSNEFYECIDENAIKRVLKGNLERIKHWGEFCDLIEGCINDFCEVIEAISIDRFLNELDNPQMSEMTFNNLLRNLALKFAKADPVIREKKRKRRRNKRKMNKGREE